MTDKSIQRTLDMSERDMRRLVRVLGWRVRKARDNRSPTGHVWRLTTHNTVERYERLMDVVSKVDSHVGMHWMIGRAGHLLTDLLENPASENHRAAWTWYRRNDRWADQEAWDLVTVSRYRFATPNPSAWSDAELARLRIDFEPGGALLRAVERELVERSAASLVRQMPRVARPSGRFRL